MSPSHRPLPLRSSVKKGRHVDGNREDTGDQTSYGRRATGDEQRSQPHFNVYVELKRGEQHGG